LLLLTRRFGLWGGKIGTAVQLDLDPAIQEGHRGAANLVEPTARASGDCLGERLVTSIAGMGMADNEPLEETLTYPRLSRGDPSKIVLVQIEERDGETYAGFIACALRVGKSLPVLSQPLRLSVREALAHAKEGRFSTCPCGSRC
jgi:hypothetical protein